MLDAIYTPQSLADQLVSLVPSDFEANRVADLCAGDGALVSAALRRFPRAELIVNDISEASCAELRHNFGHAHVSCFDAEKSDLFDQESSAPFSGALDLVLANPPFSGRGARAHDCYIAGRALRCSRALAFVCNWLPAVAPDGVLLAILPAGTITNSRDQMCWGFIGASCEVQVRRLNGCRKFKGSTVEVALTMWRRKSRGTVKKPRLSERESTTSFGIELVRGNLPVYKMSKCDGLGRIPQYFVHSTHLTGLAQGDSIEVQLVPQSSLIRRVEGPAVLVPRVGRPRKAAIVVLDESRPVVISDCVIAIKGGNLISAERIYHLIIRKWSEFEELYGGTCAKFVTLRRLDSWLSAALGDTSSKPLPHKRVA